MLSIIVPCYNEQEVLPLFYKETGDVIASLTADYRCELIFVDDGSEDNTLSFDIRVSFGANSANPHHVCDGTKLTKNTAVLFDWGAKYQEYCADMTRCFWFGPNAPKEYQTILSLAKRAHDTAAKKAKYKMTGAQIDKIARDIIEKAGYGKYFTHRTGHGIGMQDHERADISQINNEPILENYCFSIEPGIYLEGKYGVRWEDCFYMTKRGIKQIK